MGKQESPVTGAAIERGRIAEVTASGYRVKNLDRPGLISCVMTGTDNTAYKVEDLVYFFQFNDGNGKILCKI